VRKTTDGNGKFNHTDYETVVRQIEINNQYGIPSTYALKYDALMDPKFQKLFKSRLTKHDDLGCWWEITKSLAKKSGVKWLGENEISLHVNQGYSLAYSVVDRKRLIDTYMEDFLKVFGKYPTSIGAWVIDIETFKYAHEHYGIQAGTICRDQMGVDGFTLYGGYYDQIYYPSLRNEFIPAQTKEMQLDMPIFRLLGPDPIYNFEDGIRKDIGGVYTMEPVWERGKSPKWVDWYFSTKNNEELLSYSYTQVGQENTFVWANMEEGYEMQIEKIFNLARRGKIRLETLNKTADWFKKRYKLTPASSVIASNDWHKNNLKTLWYSSRYYRTSFLIEEDNFFIRDLFLFNELYESRYLHNPLTDKGSKFDALPIIAPHMWKNGERSKLSIINKKTNRPIQLKTFKFKKLNDKEFLTNITTKSDKSINIICNENSIQFNSDIEIVLIFSKLPNLKFIKKNSLNFQHNNFDYNITFTNSTFQKTDNKIIVSPSKKQFYILLSNRSVESKVITNFKNPDLKFKPYLSKEKQCIKPIFNKKLDLKEIGKLSLITIKNPNSNSEIRYTTNGTKPNKNSKLYTQPIQVNENCIIKAIAIKNGYQDSRIATSKNYRSIKINKIKGLTNATSNKTYNKNGAFDLVNGDKGSITYTDGNWLGYLDDMNVVIDLESKREINNINLSFLQNTRAWIIFPVYVEFWGSNDNLNFKSLGKIETIQTTPLTEVGIQDYNLKPENAQYRYLKVFAKWQGDCPEWSPCYKQGVSYMFVDEICVE
jgi:hypothetical protein